jgi:steroid delta-isomerase-like uncharacterized protein
MDITRREATRGLLERLIVAYNRHDPEACAGCYADGAMLWDQSWNAKYSGRNAIREHYEKEFRASPDIVSMARGVYESSDGVAIEYVIRGTHEGEWRGLPATGHHFEMNAWATCRTTPDGKLLTEARFLYDRASVFQQLGILHDPGSWLGKALTVLSHPVTMVEAARKRISVRPTPH